jgi:hypothetical protein
MEGLFYNLCEQEAGIKYTDDKINKLVFELYGLSEEEVEIVEGGIKLFEIGLS